MLPRRFPGGYDMVVCAGPPKEYAEHLPELDLVRVGGMPTCHGLLSGGRIADQTVRDAQTVAWRQVVRPDQEDEALLSAVLPSALASWSRPNTPKEHFPLVIVLRENGRCSLDLREVELDRNRRLLRRILCHVYRRANEPSCDIASIHKGWGWINEGEGRLRPE